MGSWPRSSTSAAAEASTARASRRKSRRRELGATQADDLGAVAAGAAAPRTATAFETILSEC